MTIALSDIKHVAIIRGVKPDEAVAVTEAFYEAGFQAIEVPLNSPEPLASIERMVDAFGDRMLIGAGTVMTAQQTKEVADAGGKLIVAPNADAAVIAETKRLGLISMPGVITPTECFAAVAAGADGLKLFPASVVGPGMVQALKLVLPPRTPVYAVGGINPENAAAWFEAGAAGVGVGGTCYQPGMAPEQIKEQAARYF